MKAKHVAINLVIICFLFTLNFVHAQSDLSGSFETKSIYYINDSSAGAVAPDNKLGSNNYLKLDYQYKKFTVGLQFESYLPVLQGLPSALNGSGLVIKYASFESDNLRITAGDFYEQLGNGLILRAYEERAIGLNTALEGARVTYKLKEFIKVKGLAGRPREFMKKSESLIKAGAVEVDWGSLLGLERVVATTEFNIVNRFENYAGEDLIDPNVNAYSFKAEWSADELSINGEYAYKTKDNSAYSNNQNKDGSALLLELGYNKNGLGSLLTFRRLEYMQFGTTRSGAGIGRDLNYLPALTKQHAFSLANLNPHNTMANGEIGGQLDLQYRINPDTWLGGAYGMTTSINASAYFNLKGDVKQGFEFFAAGNKKLYQDLNINIEKKLSASSVLHLFISGQVFNPLVIGKQDDTYVSRVVAADWIWKVNSEASIRYEAQHLWSKDYQKNWGALLVEFAAASRWTFFVSDMYNYGATKIHYYKTGGSFTALRTRVELNYGRNREGIVCVGGICLYMPAYTGLNLSLISSF